LNFSVTYSIDVDPRIKPEDEYVPPFLLQPYVENSLWHGLSGKNGSRQLTIHLRREEKSLVCVVEDNGIGRHEAMKKKLVNAASHVSKGLSITQRRLFLLNPDEPNPVQTEDLLAADGAPAGTRVTIRVPHRKG
jgi:two-component system, LytTR family, sensor kinase